MLWFNPHPASARFCGNDPVNNVDPLGLEEKNPDDFMEKMLSGVKTRHVSGSTVDPEEAKEAAEVTMEIGRSVPESIITTMLMGGMGRGVKVVERPMVNSGAGQAIGSFLTRISRSARITGRRVVRFFSRDKTLLAEETVSVAGGGRTGANLARATKEVAREAERSAAESSGGRFLFENWHKGTFPNRLQSIEYHVGKHGKGRTSVQYTQDAMKFFNKNKGLGKDVILKDGTLGIEIQTKAVLPDGTTQKIGGYWTRDGKLVTFWD